MARGSPDWRQYAPQKTYEQLTREQNGFWHWGQYAAVAGQYGRVQLWNPPVSGVDCLVHKIYIRSSVAGSIRVTFKGSVLSISNGHGYNRFAGGPVSEAYVYYEANASAIGYYWSLHELEANKTYPIDDPYLWLPPGKDLTIQSGILNAILTVDFQWFEVVEF